MSDVIIERREYGRTICPRCGGKLQKPLVQTEDQWLFCSVEGCPRLVNKREYERATKDDDWNKQRNQFMKDYFHISEDNQTCIRQVSPGLIIKGEGLHLDFYLHGIKIGNLHVSSMMKLFEHMNANKLNEGVNLDGKNTA